jgi:DmsE family decaheme c-type cytochrome
VEYERLLVGNLMANYVGDDNCLAKCHSHDQIRKDFQHSVHGEQIASETGLPLVNCESCHGAGSLAVEHAEQDLKCNTSELLPISQFPAQAQSLICLKCHSAASTPNLIYWNASTHANSDVSCFDCHKLHQGPNQKVRREDMAELCYGCHQEIRAEYAQFSHHPVPELKMACTDCHNPHGSAADFDLQGITVKETCTRCHMEMQGPFIYEHADLNNECSNCHSPHGSPNNPLLNVSQPFLCLQCHTGHLDSHRPTLGSSAFKGGFYNRCTDCHSAIHGSNVPSAKGRGTLLAR